MSELPGHDDAQDDARDDAEDDAVGAGEPDAPPDRRRAALVLGAVAVVAALVVGIGLWVSSRGGGNGSPAPSSAPVAAPAPATSAPATTAAPSSSAPAQPHDVVAAAAPSSFVYRGAGFTIKARVCGMAYVRPLDPPGEQHHTVCWVQHDFGYAPGSSGRGTTYVLGHAWAEDSQEVLNRISEAAMRQVLPQRSGHGTAKLDGVAVYPVTRLTGDVVTLRTPKGVLRYTVRRSYAVAKEQAGNISSLMAENTRNRVVIITCGELNHVDYDYNVVVEAYLTSSQAVPATS